MLSTVRKLVAVVAVVIAALPLCAADWSEFRGPSGNSVSTSTVPTDWSDANNTAWKVAVPGRGPSSPIVVKDRVIVTCSSGPKQDRLHVVAFDTKSGKQLWHRQFWATGRTYSHPSMGVAAPTPASDGQAVYAFFSSNDLICLDLDGNLQWYRGLAHDWPKTGNDVGMSASPIVSHGVVIVQVENQGDSFACGVDARTGETSWRIKRDAQANWSSPTILPGSGQRKDVVLLQSPSGITAHDIQSGDEVWKLEVEFGTITSPLTIGKRAYLPSNGITAVEFPDGSFSPEVLWQSNKLSTAAPSPVFFEDRLYTLSNGVLSCGSARDGEVLWKLRVPGTYWATPVIAGGLIYCVNQDGEMRVVKPKDTEGEIVAENKFGEIIQATPAVADGAMYVRSDAHLWKIAK